MAKRILSLFLALVTVLTLLPPVRQVRAATEEDFNNIVAKVYDQFAASIRQKDADSKAIDELLKPAFYGNGADLVFDKSDAITATIYESALFREAFIKTVSAGICTMQDEHRTRLMSYSVCAWYDFRNYYRIRQHVDEDYGKDEIPSDKTGNLIYYNIPAPETNLSAAPNKCDTALGLVVGGSNVRFLMEQTELTDKTVTYHIRIRFTDDFNFDGSYSKLDNQGYDTAFAKLLSLMGAFLRLKSYHWRSDTELTVTVPNTCTHFGGGKYRWEKIDGELVNIHGEDLLENASAKYPVASNSSPSGKYYYKLDRGVELRHDAPWYIEFQANANIALYLGPEKIYSYTQQPQFSKNSQRLQAFEVVRQWGTVDGIGAVLNNLHTYGVNFVEAGAPQSGKCVYRIENRIAADGTNCLWLLVDGVELGTMSHYLYKKGDAQKSTDMGTDEHWASGKDFTVRYIFNESYPFVGSMNLFYLEIDTAGGYQVTEETQASCTQGAGSVTNCVLCGAVVAQSSEEAPGHTPKSIPGKAATCTEDGLSEGAVCSVCGETLQEQTTLPPLSHEGKPLPGKDPTCLEAGLTAGSACARCGEILTPQEKLPALGHREAPVSESIQPTCLLPGATEAIGCQRCGMLLQAGETLEPLGHSLEKGKCVRCGYLAYLPGDVNGDGIANYQDALTVLRISIGLEVSDSPACDMNGDGEVNYSDALMILRTSIGLE